MTKKELAKVENKELSFSKVDDELMKQMSADAAVYKDETAVEDITMPRLRILQSGSSEVKKSDPKNIKGAEEGDIFNTLTQKYFKGDEGIYFVPVKRRIVYIEWKDRESGGGLVNNYGTDSTAYDSAKLGDKGEHINPKTGHEIVKTYDTFGFLVNMKEGTFEEVVISMSKTFAKKMKIFNALIRSLCDSNGKQLPEFAGAYKIKTVAESNDSGSWFNYNIEFAGYTLGIPKIGKIMYDRAKSFAEMINNSNVKVNYGEGEEDVASDKI